MIKIQNVLFDSVKSGVDKLLFGTKGTGISKKEDGSLVLPNNVAVSFEGYFNTFPFGKFITYTTIKNLTLKIQFKGLFRLEMYKRRDDLEKEKICSILCDNKDNEPIEVSIDILKNINRELSWQESEYIFIEITSLYDNTTIQKITWHADEPDDKKLKIAICMCTYKREEYVYRNINNIYSFLKNNGLANYFDTFIADNGDSLDRKRFINSPFILNNKNHGGTGGFMSCLLKCAEKGNYTHVIFMDDDVILEPESLLRIYAFLSLLKVEYKNMAISGSMHTFEKPLIQYESGARFDGFPIPLNKDMPMDRVENLVMNGRAKDITYGAWWLFCFKLSEINLNKLPIPFFIRGDDIDFSIRNIKKIITINGICVWHKSFESKNSAYLNYYDVRNYLILEALHNSAFDVKKAVLKRWKSFVSLLLKHDDLSAEFYIDGMTDFKKGLSAFYEMSDEERHNSLFKKEEEWKIKHKIDLDKEVIANLLKQRGNNCRNKSSISCLIQNGILGIFNEKEPVIYSGNMKVGNFCGYKTSIKYDFSINEAIRSEFSRKKFYSLMFEFFKITFPLLFWGKNDLEDYRKDWDMMTTIEFWEKRLAND